MARKHILESMAEFALECTFVVPLFVESKIVNFIFFFKLLKEVIVFEIA